MRDLTGFVETRLQLLTLKPNHRMNWIGFAVAHHLNSKYASLHFIVFSLQFQLQMLCNSEISLDCWFPLN